MDSNLNVFNLNDFQTTIVKIDKTVYNIQDLKKRNDLKLIRNNVSIQTTVTDKEVVAVVFEEVLVENKEIQKTKEVFILLLEDSEKAEEVCRNVGWQKNSIPEITFFSKVKGIFEEVQILVFNIQEVKINDVRKNEEANFITTKTPLLDFKVDEM